MKRTYLLPCVFDMASYVRDSPGRKASGTASPARSLITYCGDGEGDWNDWMAAQSRAKAATWLLIEISRRALHFT
ncbi:hypothetical protein B0O99DRAFT_317272 [Bisporella sp. PMI_857]|nr:hypothetical protein B0O99DRAFT_317272 [Bisporella sp. PMI_857]